MLLLSVDKNAINPTYCLLKDIFEIHEFIKFCRAEKNLTAKEQSTIRDSILKRRQYEYRNETSLVTIIINNN